MRRFPLRNSNFPNSDRSREIVWFDEEDAFKKRGNAFENEYVRRITQEQLNSLKKRIEKEKKSTVRQTLEKERRKLEEALDKLTGSDKSKA